MSWKLIREIFRKKEELDKAIEDFNKAIELNPELADAYTNRGLTYKNKVEFDKAVEDCNKAIGLDPRFAEAYNNLGLGYKEKGDFDKSIDDYNRECMFSRLNESILKPQNPKTIFIYLFMLKGNTNSL